MPAPGSFFWQPPTILVHLHQAQAGVHARAGLLLLAAADHRPHLVRVVRLLVLVRAPLRQVALRVLLLVLLVGVLTERGERDSEEKKLHSWRAKVFSLCAAWQTLEP